VQFHFADHKLDTDRRELRRGSEGIEVEPQVLDLLENRDRFVSKDDLVASVWGGRIVSDATLTSRIYAARKAVGDSGRGQKLIRTIARKGFRFVGAVRTQPTVPNRHLPSVDCRMKSTSSPARPYRCAIGPSSRYFPSPT